MSTPKIRLGVREKRRERRREKKKGEDKVREGRIGESRGEERRGEEKRDFLFAASLLIVSMSRGNDW